MTSDAATLTVQVPLSITQQPSRITVDREQPAVFSVTATGVGQLRYEWQYSWSAYRNDITAVIIEEGVTLTGAAR